MTGRLIALYSPRPQSGKSTVAAHLDNSRFERMAFADGLKAMTTAFLTEAGIFPSYRYVYGSLKEEQLPGFPEGITSRHIQRTLGVEWGRKAMYGDLWVDLALTKAKRLLVNGLNVVIDDMRFPNEYAAVVAAGGSVYRIVRGGERTFPSDGHSEALLEPLAFTDTILNDGTVEDLKAKVSAILQLPCSLGELS